MSPDRTLVRMVERCTVALGHTALTAQTVDDARAILTRAEVDIVCVDGVIADEAERLWRWAAQALDGGLPPAVLLASAIDTHAPSTVPAFLRKDGSASVTKPVRSSDLARELTRLLAAKPGGDRDAPTLRAGGLTLEVTEHKLLFETGGVVGLTPTEARLLRCLLQRAGEFVSPDELLEVVWGYPQGTAGREVVRAHVSNIRRKLRDLGKDPQLLRSIPYLGYGIVVGEATAAAPQRN